MRRPYSWKTWLQLDIFPIFGNKLYEKAKCVILAILDRKVQSLCQGLSTLTDLNRLSWYSWNVDTNKLVIGIMANEVHMIFSRFESIKWSLP